MKNLLTLDECVNEAASQFKHAVQQALQAAGYNLKQSEVKVGAKKVRGMGTKITLNGEMIGFDDNVPEMIASFTKSIQEDPEKYGLKEAAPKMTHHADVGFVADLISRLGGIGRRHTGAAITKDTKKAIKALQSLKDSIKREANIPY